MPQHQVTGRVTRRWCSCRSGLRADFDDLLRRIQPEGGQDVALRLGRLGDLPEGPCGPGVGDRVQPLQLGADPLPGPGVPGSGLGDADQQQGQPAQQDVGADPVLAPVIDRPQVEDLTSCPASRAQGASRNACIGDHASGNVPVIGIDGLLALSVTVRRLRAGGGEPGEDGAECAQEPPCPRKPGSAGSGPGVGGAPGGEPGGGGVPGGGAAGADDASGAGWRGQGRA